MERKLKSLSLVTVISSVIAAVLIVAHFLGGALSLDIAILFVAITEMLIGINQYEIGKTSDKRSYKIMGDLCIIIGIIIFVITIGAKLI